MLFEKKHAHTRCTGPNCAHRVQGAPLNSNTVIRDAIFPDFSGIPDFHKSKLSMKNL